MMTTIRTFVGVRIELLPGLRTLLRQMTHCGGPVQVMSEDKLHVTLKFLGEAPVAQQPRIEQLLAEALHGQSAFELRVEGLGAFPNLERPSVLWSGLSDEGRLSDMATRLESALEPLGFARETRPFHPHLTLARIKGRPSQEFFDLVKSRSSELFGSTLVQSVEWFRSELHSGGARHFVLRSFPLGNQPQA